MGATYYFAREAQIDALTTGSNQIFLRASKSQTHVFLGHTRGFLREVLDTS
ncbi:terminase large subunit domain-containing protein [Stenotrophomonas sp. ATs4]|uniref:terminase large subunit domain-containing protein n=1 Tax=Stenotrophomonas sp. ATs4 TaxID=3402766 RepID=UPI003F7208E6